ncbi:104aa long hypothetical protein [Pyrococcus horikoshii OT3]|uniref:Uncharacterized protein n=1 Tax=Pyrococcus horikoshii (strain ATCC 700860 / DSM 12428 / JCM 9974 / NBRC 100139 / OT-3) TaxID=70601 RepID=O59609_PYRHO|nr:104aa long hypothetical protein [Pyrococcus horikoshii OT3]
MLSYLIPYSGNVLGMLKVELPHFYWPSQKFSLNLLGFYNSHNFSMSLGRDLLYFVYRRVISKEGVNIWPKIPVVFDFKLTIFFFKYPNYRFAIFGYIISIQDHA